MRDVFISLCFIFVTAGNVLAEVTAKSYVDTIVNVLQSDIATKANDADVVHLSGDETISGTKTFTESVVVKSDHPNKPILSLIGDGSTIYFSLSRKNGSEAVLEAGKDAALFGTMSNHPFYIRTNYVSRIEFGTDGSVILSQAPSADSNNNQVATTQWVNERIKAMCGTTEE